LLDSTNAEILRAVYPERNDNDKDPSPAARDQDDSERAQNDGTAVFFRSLFYAAIWRDKLAATAC
jgi:chitodextrinase